jgi:uncharacterized delta-60 repeat protein
MTLGLALVAATAAFAASAGDLDRSFGRHGIAVVRNFPLSPSAAAVGHDNRVVAVAGHGTAFKITRTLPDGDIDERFGDRGVVKVRFGQKAADPTARLGLPRGAIRGGTSVAVGRKGGIVVAGTVCSDFSFSACHFGVARLRPNGDLNRDFGGDGKAEINFPKRYIRNNPSVALGADGRIVVAGSNGEPYKTVEWDIALAALRSDGSLDPQFGAGGKVVGSFAPAGDHCSRHAGYITGMALDSRDRVVVAGECMRQGKSAVARFDRSGELDPSFSGDGVVNRDLGLFNVDALAIDKRDRVDVMGKRDHSCAVARLRTDGRVDGSFGRNGLAERLWAKRSADRAVSLRSVAVDPRGRIVVGGSRSFGFAFARFKPNGHVDRPFGHRGQAVVKEPNRNFHLDLTGAAVIDTRDRIIGAGVERYALHSGNIHLALVRLHG